MILCYQKIRIQTIMMEMWVKALSSEHLGSNLTGVHIRLLEKVSEKKESVAEMAAKTCCSVGE